jgi:uncharacterized protein (DUF1330 family)
MPAYIISVVEIIDESAAKNYMKLSDTSIMEYGCRYLVRGAIAEVMEGDAYIQPSGMAVLTVNKSRQSPCSHGDAIMAGSDSHPGQREAAKSRRTGGIVQWNPDKTYGFVPPDNGAHVSRWSAGTVL